MSDITIINMSFSIPDKEGKVGYIPLGPLYITSMLESVGYDVDFKDYLVDVLQHGSEKRKVLDFFHKDSDSPRMEVDYMFNDFQNVVPLLTDSARIIGIGCTSGTLPQVILTIEELKKREPDKTIILGGIGPTGVAEVLLKTFPCIDIIVRGEGEETIVEVIQNLDHDLSKVAGICYRSNGNVIVTPERKRISDLDKLPFPAHHKINLNDYTVTSVAASRGCTYACTFCDTTQFWGRKNIVRSVDNVIEEVKFLIENYGLNSFEFVDDNFVIHRQWLDRFCDAIKAQGLKIEWNCNGRVGLMDTRMMEKMADSGCNLVFYGIESGSDPILEKVKKKFTRKQAVKTIKESLDYFSVMPSFIWGYPFETLDDLKQTLDFYDLSKEWGCMPWLLTLTPLPLSPLYQEYKHTLRFNDQMISKMGKTKKAEKTIAMIREHPTIFPGFHHYHHDTFEEKYSYVIENKYMDPDAPTAYLNGVVISKWE